MISMDVRTNRIDPLVDFPHLATDHLQLDWDHLTSDQQEIVARKNEQLWTLVRRVYPGASGVIDYWVARILSS